MRAQAYEGYFENGCFYTDGKTLPIPEHRRVFITILDDIAPDIKRADALEARKEFGEAFNAAQKQSAANGTSEISLNEINDIIAECRQEANVR